MQKLKELPSELIEPYLAKFMGSIVQSIGMGYLSPQEAKGMVSGVDWFVSSSCGIHARLASTNILFRFSQMQDSEIMDICKKVVKSICVEND